MSECVAILLFLNLVAFVSIKVCKKIFHNEEPTGDDSVAINKIGQPADNNREPPSSAEFVPSYAPATANNHGNGRNRSSVWPGLLLAAATGVIVFFNHDRIQSLTQSSNQAIVSSSVSADMAEPATPTFTADKINIVSQTKVDGVYWYEVSGLNIEGEKVQGWFTEFALKPEPAKENKAVDSISQKLGLPTTEERVNYIKKLKKVNSALKTALDNNKKPNGNN